MKHRRRKSRSEGELRHGGQCARQRSPAPVLAQYCSKKPIAVIRNPKGQLDTGAALCTMSADVICKDEWEQGRGGCSRTESSERCRVDSGAAEQSSSIRRVKRISWSSKHLRGRRGTRIVVGSRAHHTGKSRPD